VQVFSNLALTSFEFPALTSIGNQLLISDNALTSISLPALTSVGGYVIVGSDHLYIDRKKGSQQRYISANTALTSISFPKLTSVGGKFRIVDNTSLTSISFPKLTSVGMESVDLSTTGVWTGSLIFSSNPKLISISLPTLTSVGGRLHISSNKTLSSIELPALTTVGYPPGFESGSIKKGWGVLEIWGNAALASISIPVLKKVNDRLYVNGLTKDFFLELPALTSVTGEVLFIGVDSFELPVLSTVGSDLKIISEDIISFEFPALTSIKGMLIVKSCKALTSFSLPKLTSVGAVVDSAASSLLKKYYQGFIFHDNISLAQCLIDAAVEKINSNGEISNGTCFCYESAPNWACCDGSTNNTDCTCSEVNGVLEATCP